MTIEITSRHQWQMYLIGIIRKAHHHSPNVTDIIPTIAGNIDLYADQNSIEVGEREGKMKNEIWFRFIGDNQYYYFVYNHGDEMLDMKEGGRGGNIIAKFDNYSTPIMVKAVFEKLWRPIQKRA